MICGKDCGEKIYVHSGHVRTNRPGPSKRGPSFARAEPKQHKWRTTEAAWPARRWLGALRISCYILIDVDPPSCAPIMACAHMSQNGDQWIFFALYLIGRTIPRSYRKQIIRLHHASHFAYSFIHHSSQLYDWPCNRRTIRQSGSKLFSAGFVI